MSFLVLARTRAEHHRPNHSGELHWNARLTIYEVAEIFRRCEKGESYADLAAEFNISRTHVRSIHRRERRTNG